MTRPRAADDFATIHARLAELRREREQAAKQDGRDADEPGRDGQRMARNGEGRYRPDKGDLPGFGVGRRYLPVRQR